VPQESRGNEARSKIPRGVGINRKMGHTPAMLRLVPRYFLRGLLVLAPVAVTLYLVYWLLHLFDSLVPLGIPGLGTLVTVVFVTGVGVVSSNVIGRRVIDMGDRLLKRVPFVKLLYTSIKDLVGAFVGDQRKFDKPVLVSVSTAEGAVQVPGFVTREQLVVLGLTEHVAVYLPQAYNFAGNVILVRRELVKPLSVPSAELMTFIVSGGISGFGVGTSMLPPSSKEGARAPK
jgi:uncharacterized membrane protein